MKAVAVPIVLGCAVLLAGCLSQSARSSVEGSWASNDGVFVASFDNGAFTSRLTGTGEVVVADGRYQLSRSGVQLSWTSIAANEHRAAACAFQTPSVLTCTPSVGEPFSMTRVA